MRRVARASAISALLVASAPAPFVRYTFTPAVAVAPLADSAVITAVPRALADTRPSASTLATAGSLEVQLTVPSAFSGRSRPSPSTARARLRGRTASEVAG